MDANGDGTIDLEEWTTCMTPELRRGIYKSLSNPGKLKGFQPLVDVAKVRHSFYKNRKSEKKLPSIKKSLAKIKLNKGKTLRYNYFLILYSK